MKESFNIGDLVELTYEKVKGRRGILERHIDKNYPRIYIWRAKFEGENYYRSFTRDGRENMNEDVAITRVK